LVIGISLLAVATPSQRWTPSQIGIDETFYSGAVAYVLHAVVVVLFLESQKRVFLTKSTTKRWKAPCSGRVTRCWHTVLMRRKFAGFVYISNNRGRIKHHPTLPHHRTLRVALWLTLHFHSNTPDILELFWNFLVLDCKVCNLLTKNHRHHGPPFRALGQPHQGKQPVPDLPRPRKQSRLGSRRVVIAVAVR
jgi:hypothetical protein